MAERTPGAGEPSWELSPQEARRRMEQGAALIDVREPEEFAQARVPGAISLPMSELEARLDELERHGEIVFMCRSGARSARVVSLLRQLGYRRIYNLAGGILEWHREQYPVEIAEAEA